MKALLDRAATPSSSTVDFGCEAAEHELPDEMMISAITTAELSVGVLVAAGPQELARRMKVLQVTEAEFDPLPFAGTAAREYGQSWTTVIASGHKPALQT